MTSLQDAIRQSAASDTIQILPGVYFETNIEVNKPLTITGVGKAVIDGRKKGEIFLVTADSVTIENLTIRNVGTSYTNDWAAVRIRESSHFSIQNLRLRELFFGIYLERASYGIIKKNVITGEAKDEYNSGNGIQLWYSNNIDVSENTIEGVRDGIYLEFSDSVHIENNRSANNLRYGLHFMFSNHDTYEGNTFEANGSGVAVMFSKRIVMKQNTFLHNWGTASYGLLLKEINDARIIGNSFIENTAGISIEGSNRVTYAKNTFKNNGWAVKVRGACYENVFEKNNFFTNSFDLSYNSKVNNNIFSENYWSNYTGYDLNKDGFGDVPYRPVKLFSYIVNRTPETIILMRSLFIDIIDFSEKVSPVFTPDNLVDESPKMKKIQ